jgi:hypothetical protein
MFFRSAKAKYAIGQRKAMKYMMVEDGFHECVASEIHLEIIATHLTCCIYPVLSGGKDRTPPVRL